MSLYTGVCYTQAQKLNTRRNYGNLLLKGVSLAKDAAEGQRKGRQSRRILSEDLPFLPDIVNMADMVTWTGKPEVEPERDLIDLGTILHRKKVGLPFSLCCKIKLS